MPAALPFSAHITAVIAMVLIAVATPSVAGPSSQVIGLGLSELHWGMSPKEVHAAYPALQWRDVPQDSFEWVESYAALGCTFTIAVTFLSRPSRCCRAFDWRPKISGVRATYGNHWLSNLALRS